MLHDAELVAFVPATDLVRAAAFYGDVLGLRIVHDDGFAVVLDAHGTTVRITQVPGHLPTSGTVLGWQVTDLASVVDAAVGRGVAFVRYDGFDQDDRGIWRSPGGDGVAWFRDPDGNRLSLSDTP